MLCETADPRVATVDDDHDALDTHTAVCLRCQAEQSRSRRLQRELQRLGSQRAPVVDGLLEDILVALDRSGRTRALQRRAIQAVGTLVAAAGAAGAIVVVGRARNRRLVA